TDRPTVDILGWYCASQDDEGGESLLIDTSDLPHHFHDEELEVLGQIMVAHYVSGPQCGEIRQLAPLVSRARDGWDVFFVPWNCVPPPEQPARGMLDRFVRYVENKAERDPLSIRMEPGQCLFIKNLRLLHGRGQLPDGSRRHLIRYYIRSH